MNIWPDGYCAGPYFFMMTSSNGNFFRVTGLLCDAFAGHRWILLTKGQWRGDLMYSLICAWTNSWENNRDAGDLRFRRAYSDVTLMRKTFLASNRVYILMDQLTNHEWPQWHIWYIVIESLDDLITKDHIFKYNYTQYNEFMIYRDKISIA